MQGGTENKGTFVFHEHVEQNEWVPTVSLNHVFETLKLIFLQILF